MTDETEVTTGENSPEDILSVFSMEFEKPEEKKEETPAAPQENTESASQTEEAVSTEGTAGNVEGEPKVEEVAESKEPSQPASATPTAPTSDQLLADALKVIERLSSKPAEKPSESRKEKEEAPAEGDEDTKVFRPKTADEYIYNISPKLLNGLFSSEASDEERIEALKAYAAGISITVHNKILQELGGWAKANFSAIPGAVDFLISRREKTVSSQQSIRDDFYGAFPELNKAELLPLVKATIGAVQKETGAKNWDTNFRNAVGNRVKSILTAYSQANRPIPQAPISTPQAASPAPAKTTLSDPNSPEAILDVFNSDF